MNLYTPFLSIGKLSVPLALTVALPLFSAGSACAQSNPATSAAVPSASQLVAAVNSVFGQHPGYRAVHAKGIVLEGQFVPSAAAASVSKAGHLQRATVPVTVRFSNFAGIPDLADNHPLASPHGLAIKFTLPDGSQTDVISHSFNGFPSATTSDFRDLLLALGASGPNAAKPTALDSYLGSHPVAKAFLSAAKPAPVSYATLPYFGVNTFKFINAKGAVTLGRYQFIPMAGNQNLTEQQTASASPNYLQDEIRQRVAQAPLKFQLVLQVARKGDQVDNPSIAWPDSRDKVLLGTLLLTHVVADSDAAQKKLLFVPNALTAGIEVEDPMVAQRAPAYPLSFAYRSK